jgi:creatinine amidohydrolase
LQRSSALRLLIPLGATEQHGPHLPLDTDTVIASALAEAAGTERNDIAVAPVLPYGSSGEHAGFPGTLSLGQDAFEAALVELVRSADRFAGVVLLSWHGGNDEPVARAVSRLSRERRDVRVWRPCVDGADAHAGRFETSLMLAIAPGLVHDARPAGAPESLARLMPVLRERGVKAVSSNGVLGDARGATAAEGRALFRDLVGSIGAFLDAAPLAFAPA